MVGEGADASIAGKFIRTTSFSVHCSDGSLVSRLRLERDTGVFPSGPHPL